LSSNDEGGGKWDKQFHEEGGEESLEGAEKGTIVYRPWIMSAIQEFFSNTEDHAPYLDF